MNRILVSSFFLTLLTGRFASAITLWPFVILRKSELKANENLMRHEKIHLKQQAELMVVFFYLWYVFEYGVHWLRLRNRKKAYYRISFEREAYAHEGNPEYLEKRRMFAFLKYV
ncbi:MAG: hypothetical protein IPM34_12985 [Saprospiraceae bacterium]|nr:hypothetical protein [Saprospiraceae bacterium]